MECQECENGRIVVLRTKGQMHPHREGSILTNPERYFYTITCSNCAGSGVIVSSSEAHTAGKSAFVKQDSGKLQTGSLTS